MRISKAVLFGLLTLSFSAQAYYGNRSTEATLTYTAAADVLWDDSKAPEVIKKPGHFKKTYKSKKSGWTAEFRQKTQASPKTLLQLNSEGPMREKAIELVQEQIQHLMGTFQSDSFKKDFSNFGVLGEQQNYYFDGKPQINFKIEFTDVQAGTSSGRIKLIYRFTGRTVFDKGAFKPGPLVNVPIRLPLSPDLIYTQSLSVKNGEPFNYCTDEHYNSEGDFWYFWDPKQKGCKLASDKKVVLNIKGQLKVIPNSKNRYPNYKQLYGSNGNDKTLQITLLIGYIDDLPNYKVGNTKDISYANFMTIGRDLEKRGFTSMRDSDHYKDNFRITYSGREIKGANFLRHYFSTIQTEDGRTLKVVVRMLLADTDIGSMDSTFHNFLVPAFEESDVLIYDGHSGLGANLDISSFPDVQFDKNKYQLFFFNGCSSYSYYNGMFFEAKGGTKNLDIVNSGLETSSDSVVRNANAFLRNIISGKLASYGTILHYLEQSNGIENGTYLTGVTGELNANNQKPK